MRSGVGSEPSCGFDRTQVGATLRDSHSFVATPAHIASFDAVVGWSTTAAEHSVHPLYTLVPSIRVLRMAHARLLPSAADAFPGVHASSRFEFHRAVRPGDELTNEAVVLAATPTSAGTAVEVLLRTIDSDRQVVCEQWNTALAVGLSLVDEPIGVPSSRTPTTDRSPPFDVRCFRVPANATRDFAAVQGTSHPIHDDHAAARSAGFPGVIAHGNHLLALACTALLGDGSSAPDPSRLGHFEARLKQAVRPGTGLELTMWRPASGVCAFEVTSSDGAVVIGDGRARLARV